MSTHRTHRLWRAAGLQASRKRPRRQVAASLGKRFREEPNKSQVSSGVFVFDDYLRAEFVRVRETTYVGRGFLGHRFDESWW